MCSFPRTEGLWLSAYFIRHWHDLPQQQDILAQLWKEYALSDSRYLTKDPEVLSLEVITVVRLTVLAARRSEL